MNSTDSNSGGFLGSENIGGFGYGIGVSVGILLLITTITLTSYFCTRIQIPPAQSGRAHQPNPHNGPLEPATGLDFSVVTIESGIDEATLLSYPKMLYSEAKNHNKVDSTATCCSICLADYKNSDLLRLLPDCGHLFHLKCVDPWLRLHPTCPVCRTSPMPTPLSTPLAEVTPLAIRRD
ncbi:Zinc finger, RING-type [Dillenia turbinata]|uniref:RING-type E3 ubiquitin transferase n=1 Tax=Dillenia turbinata TaxID=194707 RepID=A0AAN8ZNB8_9MAGN